MTRATIHGSRSVTRLRNDAPSEDELAVQLIDHLMLQDGVPVVRWVEGFGHWMRWTGTQWTKGETVRIWEKTRLLLRQLGITRVGASMVTGIERLARSDSRCIGSVDEWDQHPMLLNTPGGIVDLTTGVLSRNRADLRITRMTPFAPEGGCPRWVSFLEEVTGGDVELQRFLQCVAGYCLTGSVDEHALFFFYGTGGNGKGVFLNTLCKVLGNYASIAPMETFTASSTDRHPTELAALRGARLVVSQETEEGRRWAESRIKALTGGDPISARFMHRDFFTFSPEFKLLIAGNHKPALRNVDAAMRRRLHLIPFSVTIPEGRKDIGLAEKLLAEAGGILRWAIEGCLEWQRIGLSPPKRVRDATADYFETQDALQAWVEDCCEVGPNRWELPAALFSSWSAWAEKAGEHVGNQRSFGDRLESAGFPRSRSHGVRRHDGIALRHGPGDAR